MSAITKVKSLPEKGFLRLPQVLSIIPVSSSTWWSKVKEGAYPQPIKIGANITVWQAEDIWKLHEELSKNKKSTPKQTISSWVYDV
jgi:predicted DNA-binding transcriptional regulator AlpA